MNSSLQPHLIITGMHRSGTSYLSRALNLSGVNLGPISQYYDTEITPITGNAKGHWENVEVNHINEEILKTNDCSWDHIPNTIDKIPSNLSKRINDVFDSFHKSKSVAYGFKDPRFCITLDKWIPFFDNPIIIGIFRNPLKVAESLKIRNNFSYDKSLLLWEMYNTHLIKYLKKHNGFLINFDWEKNKLFKEITLICQKLNLTKINLDYWFSTELKQSDKSFNPKYELSKDSLRIYDELNQISEQNHTSSYSIPSLSVKDFKEIMDDYVINSNLIYDNVVNQSSKEIKILQNYLNSKKDPLSDLLSIFYSRTDLLHSFPEVNNGNYSRLIDWAIEICESDSLSEMPTKQSLLESYSWYKEKNMENRSISNLNNQIKIFQNQISDLNQEILNLQSTINEQETAINEQQTAINEQQTAINEQQTTINEQQTTINEQHEIIQIHEIELNNIKSSFGFKFTRVYGSIFDKIIRKSSRNNMLTNNLPKNIVSKSVKIIKNEGVRSLLRQSQIKLKQNELFSSEHSFENLVSIKHMYSLKKDNFEIKKNYNRVLIVIKTKFNSIELKFLVKNLFQQKGFDDIQVILLVDKNFTLDNELSELKNLQIIVNNSDENSVHIIKKNIIGNEFLILVNNDIFPVTNHTFFDLCTICKSEPEIGLVSCREILTPDSDLFYAFIMNHNDENFVYNDIINYNEKFDMLSIPTKINLALNSTSCFCIRSEIISDELDPTNYFTQLNTKIKILNDYKIIHSYLVGAIIQSKHASSYYLTKKFYQIAQLCHKTQSYNVDENTLKIPSNEIFNEIFSLYSSLRKSIDVLKKNNSHDIKSIFDLLSINLKKDYSTDSDPSDTDVDLDNLFSKFPQWNNHHDKKHHFVLLENYLKSLQTFEKYLIKVYPNLDFLKNEFYSTLYKIFADLVGMYLANYTIFNKKYVPSYEHLNNLEQVLIEAIQ
jgi:hypothetical protein